MDKPSPDAIKKQVEDLSGLVDLVAEIWHGRNWVRRLLLLDILLFLAFNPYLKTVLRFIPESWLPRRYELFFWLVIGAVFLLALVIGIRARAAKRQSRSFAERSTIKGLLPFGFADREVFKQLQREADLTECFQAVTDRNFRFGLLSGESGAGKTSFLQAGLWPALLDQHRCVYVKFTDLDPAAAIRQAFIEQNIGIPETTPVDAPLSTLLAGVAQADAKPLVLLLDQFEQFFVHFKRESRRRPFIRELNEWYRNGRGLPIKILLCIRGDFLDHLSELQDAMGYSLGPQQKFRLKKFRPEQAAAVFRVIAESETLDCDESFLNELTERELAGADDGLISPVDIQILAWMIAGQAGHEERAFNRATFQKLGGVEGLLERFLTRALEARETPARRQAATKVLLALTDLDRNARAGALNLDELKQKLGGALTDAELKEAVEWLSRGDVRLIAPVKRGEIDACELAHERLIPALRRIAGKELSEADRASLLLDRRFNEWTGNNRDRRYRLTWRELRSVKKQMPFLQWEPNRGGKESLIAASWRQIRLRFILASLPVLLAIAFASVWYSQWGQLQLIKWSVAEYSDEMAEPEVLIQITRTYAVMGDFPKALRIAEKIGDEESKASALQAIAEAYTRLGEKEKAAQLLSQALSLADKIGNESDKASALQAIAKASARLGEKGKAAQLLSQALSIAEKIGGETHKVFALQAIAETSARIGEKEKAAELLSQALSIAEKFGVESFKASALQAIAEIYARIGEKEKDAQLLSQALSLAEKIGEEYHKADALQDIVVAYARIGEKEEAARLLSQALSIAEKIGVEYHKARALQAITEASAKLGEKEKAARLLSQALSIAEKIGDEGIKADALQDIAEAYARLGEKEKAARLLSQALSVAERIGEEFSKAIALQAIAEASAKLGEKEKAAQLLSQTLSIAEKIGEEYHKAIALQAIAEASAKLGEKEKAAQLLSQTLSIAEKIGDEDDKVRALSAIAEAYAKLGDFRLARASALKIPSDSGKAKTLASILEIWAKSKNPRLADEVSNEEE